MNLKTEMAQLPRPTTNKKPPEWDYWRFDLWQRAQADKPENFTKWPCVFHTMLQDHWPDSIKWEFYQLPTRWQQLAILPPHLHDDYLGFSLALIHQLYHLYQWQLATGLRIDTLKSIYEFGGGFGLMALACRRLGFTGKYTIYDLPEFSLLQQWYLKENNISGIKWQSELKPLKADLLIACYSLSEVDYALRADVFDKIKAKSYLLLYSNRFEEYDNLSYFVDLRLTETWQSKRLEHLPPESWYTFGS